MRRLARLFSARGSAIVRWRSGGDGVPSAPAAKQNGLQPGQKRFAARFSGQSAAQFAAPGRCRRYADWALCLLALFTKIVKRTGHGAGWALRPGFGGAQLGQSLFDLGAERFDLKGARTQIGGEGQAGFSGAAAEPSALLGAQAHGHRGAPEFASPQLSCLPPFARAKDGARSGAGRRDPGRFGGSGLLGRVIKGSLGEGLQEIPKESEARPARPGKRRGERERGLDRQRGSAHGRAARSRS